jgi:N-acetylmuramoyl-L-alanine amidase
MVALAVSLIAGCATKSSYYRLDPSLSYDVRNIDGYQYVPLTKLCDAYGMNCSWDTIVRTATITGRSGTIILRAGSDTVLSNGTARKIARPVVLSGGTVFVPVSFVRENFMPAVARAVATSPVAAVPEAEAPKKFAIKTIVLDTGHGGKDVGAVGPAYGTKEKSLALVLSKKIKAILESNGIRVIMTRGDDTFISLERRADIANKSGAELFVSVHINASRSRAMRGFECYYLSNATDDTARALQAFEDSSLKLSDSADAMHSSQLDKTLWDMSLTENRTESGELAGYICSSVQDSLAIKNRGVRTARFYVLKNTNIPSVLVEAGYLSNRLEELQLKDPAVLDRLAESIARGILRYKKRYESTEGFTNV